MSTEDPIKSKFTCPTCGNNVTAGAAEVADPVPCPHCGVVGQFQPAMPKTGEAPTPAPDSFGAAEFSSPPLSSSPPEPDPVPPAHTRHSPPRRKKLSPPSRRTIDGSQKRSRPGYRRHTPKPAPAAEGSPLMTVFLIIIAIALSVIIILIMLPRNLDFIHGYPAGKIGGEKPRNLLAETQPNFGSPDRAVAFTEEEVNAYLNYRIKGTQKGPLSPIVKFKGAYADFEAGQAEFYIERTVIGIPFTMSMKVTKKQLNAKTIWRAGGGSIGRFRLSSQQFKPIIDAFVRMGQACEEEIDAVKKMGSVRFEPNRIVLDMSYSGDSKIEPAPAPATTEPKTEPTPGSEEKPEPGTGDESMEGTKPDGMDGTKPTDMEGAKPEAMDGAKPDDMEGAKPEAMDGAKPDDMEGAKPEAMDGAKPDDMEGAKPEGSDEAKPESAKDAPPPGSN